MTQAKMLAIKPVKKIGDREGKLTPPAELIRILEEKVQVKSHTKFMKNFHLYRIH